MVSLFVLISKCQVPLLNQLESLKEGMQDTSELDEGMCISLENNIKAIRDTLEKHDKEFENSEVKGRLDLIQEKINRYLESGPSHSAS